MAILMLRLYVTAQQLYASQSASTVRIGIILPVLRCDITSKQKQKRFVVKRGSEIKYRSLQNIVISNNGDYCFEIVRLSLHLVSIDSSSFLLLAHF